MKILFISQYYPPEIGAASNRIGYFAQFLAKKGHDVSVLTSAPNYPDRKIYPGYQNRMTKEKENGVMVYRTWIYLSTKANIASRLAHYLSFLISSVIQKFRIPKPDIIIATSPPLFVGIIGVIFKKLWRLPLVVDIRDLWPESVESVGAVKNKLLLSQGQKLADWIYKNATHITATSPGIQKNLPKNIQRKITIIPNGAEMGLFRSDADSEHMRRRWNLTGKFVVAYTGNLGLAQAPEVFIEAAKLCENDTDIVFLLVGSGVLFKKLKLEATENNLTNVILTGPQPRKIMPDFVAASDVCIIPYRARDTFRNTYPSKMFDYMAGGKPIIINLKGEASDLIEKANCGLIADEESGESLKEKILWLKRQPETTAQMGLNGKEFVEKYYVREVIAAQLEETLLSCCHCARVSS